MYGKVYAAIGGVHVWVPHMDKTTIQVSKALVDRLTRLKVVPRETYEEVILRSLDRAGMSAEA